MVGLTPLSTMLGDTGGKIGPVDRHEFIHVHHVISVARTCRRLFDLDAATDNVGIPRGGQAVDQLIVCENAELDQQINWSPRRS